MKRIIFFIMVNILVGINLFSQDQYITSDTKILELLKQGLWGTNTWSYSGWAFRDQYAEHVSLDPIIPREKYYVKNGIIYISNNYRRSEDEKGLEYNKYRMKTENESIFSKYAIVSMDNKYIMYGSEYKYIYGEIRKYVDYDINMGNIPIRQNDNESYYINPSDSNPVLLLTRNYHYNHLISSNVYTLNQVNQFGESHYSRTYIGSTIINNQKWYLVNLIGNLGSMDEHFNRLLWTKGIEIDVPIIIYDYYDAINKKDFVRGYNLWHKKRDIDYWITLYKDSTIGIINVEKKSNDDWIFFVKLLSGQVSSGEFDYYKVEINISPNSILSTNSTKLEKDNGEEINEVFEMKYFMLLQD